MPFRKNYPKARLKKIVDLNWIFLVVKLSCKKYTPIPVKNSIADNAKRQ